MVEISLKEFFFLLPEGILVTGAMVLLLGSLFGREMRSRQGATWSLVTLILTGAAVVYLEEHYAASRDLLANTFVLDSFAFFWKIVVLLSMALVVSLSVRFIDEERYRSSEYYSLLLVAASGMFFMASGINLISIWISLELMSLASYILAGYFKREVKSTEAALKYFILGALSSGVLLYGASLLYGAVGSVNLAALGEWLPQAIAGRSMIGLLGWLFLGVGLFFKIAAVPFHIWTPDVYVGAPTPVTAFLAVASKAASFAILLRIFYVAFGGLDWQAIVALVAALTMVWGNLAALTQQNVKRMLAYSSIAHAGYVLIGVLALNEMGSWAVLFYLLAYSFITAGAFGTVILLERKEYAGETCADYAGLAGRSPFLAAMMLIFMLALTGIPPTGGFVGKFYLFGAAVQAGWAWVALIGVLMSALSLYYYFRIVVYMYLMESSETAPSPLEAPVLVGAVAFCGVATLVMGVYPGPFIEFAQASILPLP